MSTNPYAPPESDLSKSPEQSVRRPFPFWSIGPLPWIAVAVMFVLWYVAASDFPTRPEVRFERASFVAMVTLELSIVAGLYGIFYAFVLMLVCRTLYVTPRVKPHFWTIVSMMLIGSFIEVPPILTFLSTNFVGALMAILNFQEKVD